MIKERKLQMQYRQLLVKVQQNREKIYARPKDNKSFDGLDTYDGSAQTSDIVRDEEIYYKVKVYLNQYQDNVVADKNVDEGLDDAMDCEVYHRPDEDEHQDLSQDRYDPQMINKIIEKLRVFEEEKRYLQKNLKMPDVADIVGTNRSILSHIVNVYLKIHYPDYIKTLRIRHITELMLEDKIYLKYKMESLADICGISSRQMFSLHFRQINGMSPTEFIRQRLKDLENQ